jgi:CRP-like cAMP-binding protein
MRRRWLRGTTDLIAARVTAAQGVATLPAGELPSWAGAADRYRPFLAARDLERVVTAKPSELYDAIAPILGLEPTCRGELIRLTHEQIAALVGTCRETTTKVLGEFADRGLLRPGRGRITLPGRDGITADNGD